MSLVLDGADRRCGADRHGAAGVNLTPPAPGSFTATFLCITVGVWMVPSSLGLNRWLLGPKACARWSRSPPLDRSPLGPIAAGPEPVPSSTGLVSDVAGDAPEFRVRTVSIATCCDLYEFERTVSGVVGDAPDELRRRRRARGRGVA